MLFLFVHLSCTKLYFWCFCTDANSAEIHVNITPSFQVFSFAQNLALNINKALYNLSVVQFNFLKRITFCSAAFDLSCERLPVNRSQTTDKKLIPSKAPSEMKKKGN